jgi:predicted RNase H-like HicB family nuclease
MCLDFLVTETGDESEGGMSTPRAKDKTSKGKPKPKAAPVHPVTVTVQVRLQALAVREADGRYSVIVPALPGCVTEGDDIEDVQKNVVEAAELWLDGSHDLQRDEALRSLLP